MVRAVNEFARERNLALHVTWDRGTSTSSTSNSYVNIAAPIKDGSCYMFPAWYLIKPLECQPVPAHV